MLRADEADMQLVVQPTERQLSEVVGLFQFIEAGHLPTIQTGQPFCKTFFLGVPAGMIRRIVMLSSSRY